MCDQLFKNDTHSKFSKHFPGPASFFHPDDSQEKPSELRAIPYDLINEHNVITVAENELHRFQSVLSSAVNSQEKPTYQNTATPIMAASAGALSSARIAQTLGNLRINPFSTKAELKVSEFTIEISEQLFKNKALYLRLKQIDPSGLSKAQRLALSKWISNCEKLGVNLAPNQLSRLKEIDLELEKLQQEYRTRYAKSENALYQLPAHTKFLPDTPPDIIARARESAAKHNHDGFEIPYFAEGIDQFHNILMYVNDSEIRKDFYQHFISRLNNEVSSVEKITVQIANLRLEKAKLLGKNNFAELIHPDSMAQNTETVRNFIENLRPRFQEMAEKELAEIQSLKKQLTGSRELAPWDVQFYARQLELNKLNWNADEISEYLEVKHTVTQSLRLLEKIFGLKFSPVRVPTWHPDVQTYLIERLDSHGSLTPIGYVYMDLYARDDKSNSAFADELLTPGTYLSASGAPFKQLGSVMINLNIRKADGNQPSFMTLDNLEGLLHEMGHAIHMVSYNQQETLFSSSTTPTDFIELPSQILENWMYEPSILRSLTSHYKTHKPAPNEWLQKVRQRRSLNIGLKSLARRGMMAQLDLEWATQSTPISNSHKMDQVALKDWPREKFQYLRDVAGQSSLFRYIFMHGYEAKFYSYQWSEVYDYDAFEYFIECGLLNTETGRRFLENLLMVGSLEDLKIAYREFRGRDADPMAIIRKSESGQK